MDETTFLELFGNTARTRILDFLLVHRGYDYSLTEIARYARVSWSSVNTIIPDLIRLEIVICSRNVGRSKMYKLNTKNPLMKHLLKFDLEFAFQEAKKVAKEEIAKGNYV